MIIIVGHSSQGFSKSELRHRPSAMHVCAFMVLWLRTDLGKEVPTGLALDPKAVTCLGLALCPPTRQMRGARLPAEVQIQICGAWRQERCWEVLPDHPLLQRIMMRRAAVLCWARMLTPVLGAGMQEECRINGWIIRLFQKQPKLDSHKDPGSTMISLEPKSLQTYPTGQWCHSLKTKLFSAWYNPGTLKPQGQHGRRAVAMVGVMGPFTKIEPGDQFGIKDVSSTLGKLSLKVPHGGIYSWGLGKGSWGYRVVVPRQGVAPGLFEESAWWGVGHFGAQWLCGVLMSVGGDRCRPDSLV